MISRNVQTFEKDAKVVGKIIYVKDADDLSSSSFWPSSFILAKTFVKWVFPPSAATNKITLKFHIMELQEVEKEKGFLYFLE